ncbi:MAG TPA: response regulator, partial [Elusimicrobiota bacterium]|nr:response regulator [Elusimicrobiota bacterium]
MSRLLVVEDEQDLRRAIVKELTALGHEVEEAPDGEKAKVMLRTSGYDLVISDLMLKEVNGLDVLREAKVCDPHTETILMTAFGSMESNVEAMKLGASAYLLKPLDMDELGRKVGACLERRNFYLKNQSLETEINVLRASRETATKLMLGSMMRLLLKSARDILKARGGLLLRTRQGELCVEAATNDFKDDLMGSSLPQLNDLFDMVRANRRPYALEGRHAGDRLAGAHRTPEEISAVILSPILEGDLSFGVFL